MNRWIGIGRLGRDPELRYTPSGLAVVTFSIAVDRRFKNADGTRKTDWVDCVAWQKTAEFVAERVGKGNRVCVEGRLEFDEWADKDTGKPRKGAKIVCEQVTPIDWKEKDQAADGSEVEREVERQAVDEPEDDPFRDE